MLYAIDVFQTGAKRDFWVQLEAQFVGKVWDVIVSIWLTRLICFQSANLSMIQEKR